MKQLIATTFLGLAVLLSMPTPSHALSCLEFNDSLKYHLENGSATVFTGTPILQKDYADTNGQLVKVSKVLAGAANDKEWVYFNFTKDWGYGCNAAPTTLNKEWVYVAVRDNPDERYLALYAFATGSAEVKTIEKAIADAEAAEKIGEPYLGTASSPDRRAEIEARIGSLMQEIKILFDQFKYWASQK